MKRTGHVSVCIASALLLLAASVGVAAAPRDEEKAPPPIEVYEWSVWVGSPAQLSLNGSRLYRNALPDTVGTLRPKLEAKETAEKFAIAPLSIVQFFGAPSQDIDIDLRVKKGNLLAHWPPGNERAGRVQWFKSDLKRTLAAGVPTVFLPETHWLQKLRRVETALYHQRESRGERFLAYDAELTVPIPLKLRGGPNEYTIQNLTGSKLLDVAIVAPVEGGYRVGWLDELPSAVPESTVQEKKQKQKDKDDPKKRMTDGQRVEEALAKSQEKEKANDEPKPLPAEGDANLQARMDQVLNRQVTINAAQASRKEILDLIAGQARLRYELDDKTIAKADVDLSKPTTMKAPRVAARDALADVLGSVGLSYRVTEDATLFITTAARLADAADKKNTVIEGPPITLTLSQPLKPSDPSYRELTRDSYARRLSRQGLREEVVNTLLEHYEKALFAPEEMIVLAHFSQDALEEAVLLDVFPTPRKVVRSALVVIHGIDPRLQDRARALVAKLGDDLPKNREEAEAKLFELGPVAAPVLEDALHDKDLEIVFRAERLLLRMHRPVP